MSVIILGGGLAGISLAGLLKDRSVILERESEAGGLCRSFDFEGIRYDIGPHILFSKNKQALEALASATQTHELKRSNKIFHKGKFIKYPFENELSALDPQERDYCLNEFLHNPYRNYVAQNMLQFYLKIFGEGITRTYLQPYNEKIWKFDPSYMDTQMVERIPCPPDEDIIKSAKGEETEGYKHQLYFKYPVSGGIQSIISGLKSRLKDNCEIRTSVSIEKISHANGIWTVKTNQGEFKADKLVNCMPLHELFDHIDAPAEVDYSLGRLKYNSIHIVLVKTKKDKLGKNFAVNIPDRSVIFHRLSKLGFLGSNYQTIDGESILLAEITFRQDSSIAGISEYDIANKVCEDLVAAGFVPKGSIQSSAVKTFKYAYVIYDLDHRRNTDIVLKYLSSIGIGCCGRFAEFEYLNMDAIMDRAMKFAEKLNNG